MSPNLVQVNWETRKNVLFTKLNSLRVKEVHTDITLSCDGENYPAHRLILTMSSGYFARTFEANKDLSSSIILICGIHAPILQALLSFIYDGTTTIKSQDVHELLKAGLMLEIPGLMEMGSNYLSNRESPKPTSDPLNELRVSSVSTMSELGENDPQTTPERHPTTTSSEAIICSSSDVKRDGIIASGASRRRAELNGEVDVEIGHSRGETLKLPSTSDENIFYPKRSPNTLLIEELMFSDSDDSISFEGWENDKKQETPPLLKERALEFRSNHCKGLSRVFSQQESLPEHSKSRKSPPLAHICKECGKSFRTKRLYSIHLKEHNKAKVKSEFESFLVPSSSSSFNGKTSQASNNDVSSRAGVSSSKGPYKKARSSPNDLSRGMMMAAGTSSKRLKQEDDFEECNSIDEILYSVSQSFKNLSNGEHSYMTDDSIYDTFNGHSPPAKSSSPVVVKCEKNYSYHDVKSETDYYSSRPEPSMTKLKESLKVKYSLNWLNTRICNYCDFEYINSKNYQNHRTNDCKVLECQFCLKNFNSENRSNYDIHISSHKGVTKPYSCPKCSYCTDAKRSFEDHTSIHTGYFRFWCLLCDYQSRKLSELRDHTVKEHPNIDLSILDQLS